MVNKHVAAGMIKLSCVIVLVSLIALAVTHRAGFIAPIVSGMVSIVSAGYYLTSLNRRP